jgi:hypothetical protein
MWPSIWQEVSIGCLRIQRMSPRTEEKQSERLINVSVADSFSLGHYNNLVPMNSRLCSRLCDASRVRCQGPRAL